MIKASLKNYNQTPRKVRLVANFIRGKKVQKAISELNFINKKSAFDLVKLLNSAVSNAVNNFKLNEDDLYIKEVAVNEAIKLKRYKPGARGRAFPYKRRYSTISVVLDTEGFATSANKDVKKVDKKIKEVDSSKEVSNSKKEVKLEGNSLK